MSIRTQRLRALEASVAAGFGPWVPCSWFVYLPLGNRWDGIQWTHLLDWEVLLVPILVAGAVFCVAVFTEWSQDIRVAVVAGVAAAVPMVGLFADSWYGGMAPFLYFVSGYWVFVAAVHWRLSKSVGPWVGPAAEEGRGADSSSG